LNIVQSYNSDKKLKTRNFKLKTKNFKLKISNFKQKNMAKKNHLSEAEILEITRVRLENAEKQPVVSKLLEEYGYNKEKISQGVDLRKKTQDAYNFKKKEDIETSEAYIKFKNLQEKISETYARDRKKAKAVFGKQPEMLTRLNINGSVPEAYTKWHETVKIFYATCQDNTELQTQLATLKVTQEHLKETMSLILEMETSRTDYLREKGESLEATSTKDNAFAALDDWMRDFIRVAKIALEDHPQLLETLHIKA
jgi:hypothetical protein